MLIKFNVLKTRVIFIHENVSEYKTLMSFPAFLKEGPHHYLPAKIAVVYNVVTRLQSAVKKIQIDKDVHDFMNQELKLKPLPEFFKYHTSPMPYQDIALRFIYTCESGGLLLDPGMGKSKVVLDYIHLMGFKKSIIVCPLPLLFVWEDEVASHRPELSIHLVETTDWDKEWEKGKDKHIFCLNYSKAVIFEQQLAKQGFEFIHLDEFLIKDPTTSRTQSITKLSKSIPYRCGGSGTLVNNSVFDVFAPIRFLEPSLVGWNYTNFQNRHAVRVAKNPKMIVGYRKKEEARSILESCSIVMTKDEWLKLPDKKFHDIYVQPSEKQRDFYQCLQRNYIAEMQGETVEIDNTLVMLSKLYQVAQGFVYVSDKKEEEEESLDLLAEDTKKKRKKSSRRTLIFDEQPKVAAMVNLIKNTLKEKRSIIWFNCSAEFELISKALEDNGWTYRTIKGGTKNLGSIVREYNNDPSIQFLVCQARSVNYGITILGTSVEKMEDMNMEVMPGISPGVHTQIFYSCNFSLEVFLQQQDRIHRIGQKHQCDYYRLWLNCTVEHIIKDALTDKMCIRKEMLVDIAEKLKQLDNNLV
jgi:SNF2 family DNA or RNA helicase